MGRYFSFISSLTYEETTCEKKRKKSEREEGKKMEDGPFIDLADDF